jgi:hypothetical protein
VEETLKRFVGQRLWLKGALLAVIIALGGAAFVGFYPRRLTVEIRYDHTASDVLLFQVKNRGGLPILLRMDKFEVSTMKFGKIGYDRFEVRFAKNSTLVAGGQATSIAAPAPAGAQSYLCSQLRSIGFFLDYGQLRNGKLPEPSTPDRTKQIANGLRCSFTISEAGPDDKNTVEHEIRSACDNVAWINGCVATVLLGSD